MSHYLCEDPECLQMGFVSFATSTEIDMHRESRHGTGEKKTQHKMIVDKLTMQNMTGFY